MYKSRIVDAGDGIRVDSTSRGFSIAKFAETGELS